jgi:hypothetical protein
LPFSTTKTKRTGPEKPADALGEVWFFQWLPVLLRAGSAFDFES